MKLFYFSKFIGKLGFSIYLHLLKYNIKVIKFFNIDFKFTEECISPNAHKLVFKIIILNLCFEINLYMKRSCKK